MPPAPLLSMTGINKSFGAVVIAEDLDLQVADGEGLGIIGPNGAGKSTLFNLITGDQPVNKGKILLGDVDITRTRPHARCCAGIGRSYQIPNPFGQMSVFENVLTASVFGDAQSEKAGAAKTVKILELTGLIGQANTTAGKLTLLQRKRLEMARSLATSPRILLLDEIAGGLTEGEVQALIGTIKDIRRTGIALVWIEHIVHALLATVDRLIVLNGGRIIAEGDPHEVMRSAEVQRIYMGVEPT
ncbi:ABC-transporter ATP-binding protein [Octadecabacter antarcticus 307]|uniref:ABC-transporter ATP-binding protein n=1 Tax=Octadecabacter antarcticus 307 TaxID=391626 RepID=M9R8X1_9RHOB|nr:ABC transporter ATP-binding protein [Octadecabacter antarcticus]AGI68662.1 ABC-transporter ATP-binding protein [Octadecabacter antarcticus 307]